MANNDDGSVVVVVDGWMESQEWAWDIVRDGLVWVWYGMGWVLEEGCFQQGSRVCSAAYLCLYSRPKCECERDCCCRCLLRPFVACL